MSQAGFLRLIATFFLVPAWTASPALAAPANDDCPAATPISDGVVAGTTTGATTDGAAGNLPDRSDVWFRYAAMADLRMSAYFVDADPHPLVLSVHASCPGTPLNKVGAGGRFAVAAGDEVFLRVAVREDEPTGPFTLDVGPVSTISGTVTDAPSGAPIADAVVAYAGDSRVWQGGQRTGTDGAYTVDVPRPGTYYFSTAGTDEHADEIYDDVPCTTESCADDYPTRGTPIEVGRSVAVDGIDFALERLGSIAGRVAAAATGEPIAAALVILYDHYGGEAASVSTDAAGDYAVGGLHPGTYFAAAADPAYETELHEGFPCINPHPYSGDCDPTSGTPIAVELDATTVVDFALETRGRIAGRVTVAATGEPAPPLHVRVYDAAGTYIRSAVTGADGFYAVGGLETGSYLATASGFDELATEVYDDIPCPPFYRCPLSAGDPISVEDGAVTAGVDFALDRYGRVVGTVTEAATGAPLEDVLVDVYDTDGLFASAELTDAAGRYAVPFLFTGTYFATAISGGRFQELYDGMTCPPPPVFCDVTAGTPIAVEIGSDTSGVDFALTRQGISGTVIDLARGLPIPFATVEVWNQEGLLAASLRTRRSGVFWTGILTPGTYYVTTDTGAYLDQLYAGLPCVGGCDPTAGTPVRVRANAITEGVEFGLYPLGSISGTVRSAAGEPVALASVTIWNPDGTVARSGSVTTESGAYVVSGLAAGTYHATATANDGFLASLYEGLPCPGEDCDVTAGTAIPVTLGVATTGVDFVLDRSGTIYGTVREAISGAPAGGIEVRVWDAGGDYVAEATTDSLRGTYVVAGLAPGSYFVSTLSFSSFEFDGFADQLYDGLPCFLGICDPATGTPVEVGRNSPPAPIDFALDLQQGITGRVTHQETGLPLAYADVSLWNADGVLIDALQVGPSGAYAWGLPLGTYYLSTVTHHTFFDVTDEVYDDVPCGPYRLCDPSLGTPVTVTGSEVVREVDFALSGTTRRCLSSAAALCLNDRRFRVEVLWQDFEGGVGLGQAEALTGDAGTFWFFGPDNVEVVVKVLDACVEPFDRFWVFAAGLTNVATRLTVTDTLSGEVRTYENPLGTAFELIRDTDAFDTCDLGGEGSSVASELPDPDEIRRRLEDDLIRLAAREGGEVAAPAMTAPAAGGQGSCAPSATSLCLADGRFEVETFWRTLQGDEGPGQAVTLTDDSGTFWFFGPDNVEVILKVLDACELPGFESFWVFAAGLSDVEVTMLVTDTVFGEVREYHNPLGTAFRPIQDTAAFETCP